MYAVVRRTRFPADDTERVAADMRRFESAHRAQPGYVGTVVISSGIGERVSMTLWADEASSTAARLAMGGPVAAFVQPHLATPPELLAAGTVRETDLPL